MQMSTSGTARIAHIPNVLSAGDALANLYVYFGQMRITRFDPKLMLDLDKAAIARKPARMGHYAICS